MPAHVAAAGLRPADPGEIRTALDAAAELGMFFRLADPARDVAGWQPVRLLYGAGQVHLDGLLAAVQASWPQCEPRVAASLFFQGYASRLLSPQLACLAANGCVPDLPAARLAWRRPQDQVIELGLTASAGWAAPGRRLMEHLVAVSFDQHLQPLADALRLRVRIAPALLIGNAAAALVSGLRLLSGPLGPLGPLGPDWRPLAAHALAQPALRGGGDIRTGEPAFVRRSCCLYYRVEGGGLCADCPLPRRPA